jgi:IS1 family transposase
MLVFVIFELSKINYARTLIFIPDGDQIVSKTYRTRVEGENTRLRHYLARLHRQTLCYSKWVKMLENSLPLLIHYLKFKDVPVPYTFA